MKEKIKTMDPVFKPEDNVINSIDNAPAESLTKDAFLRLIANKGAVVELIIITLLIFIALFGPYITPYDFLSQNLEIRNQGISWAHPFGTDDLGRDVLSRVIYGARTAVILSISLPVLSFLIGIIIGS